MEIEVSLKVRSAIKAKLLELGVHVDDELPDYIMVLVANRRTKQQMESDLELFLADNTKKFTTWLYHVLKKLEQVTLNDPVPPIVTKTIETELSSIQSKTKGKVKPKESSASEKEPKKAKSKTTSESKVSIEKQSKSEKVITSKESNKEKFGSKSSGEKDKSKSKASVSKDSGSSKDSDKNKTKTSSVSKSSDKSEPKGEKKVEKKAASSTSTKKSSEKSTESKVQFKLKNNLVKKTEFDRKQEEAGDRKVETTTTEPDESSSKAVPTSTTSNEESMQNPDSSSHSLHEDILNLVDDEGGDDYGIQVENVKIDSKLTKTLPVEDDEEDVQKLREIALETKSPNRRKLGLQNVDVLRGIVMNNEKENTNKRKRENDKEPTPSKSIVSSSKNSSRDSPPKKLRSVVTLTKKSNAEEYDPTKPNIHKLSSVVCVSSSQRPKRNTSNMNTNLIFKAMKEVEIENIKRPTTTVPKQDEHSRRRDSDHRRDDRSRRHTRSRSTDRTQRDRSDRRRGERKDSVTSTNERKNHHQPHRAHERDPSRSRSPLQLFTTRNRVSIKDRLGERPNAHPVNRDRQVLDQELDEYVSQNEIKDMEKDINIVINLTNIRSTSKGSGDGRSVTVEKDAMKTNSILKIEAESREKSPIRCPTESPKKKEKSGYIPPNRISIRVMNSSDESEESEGEENGKNEHRLQVDESEEELEVTVSDDRDIDDLMPPQVPANDDESSQEKKDIIFTAKPTDRLTDLRMKLAAITRSNTASYSPLGVNPPPKKALNVVINKPTSTLSFSPYFPSLPTVSIPTPTSTSASICKFWPTCSFGGNCKYTHPRCKYGDACTKRPSCPYKHENMENNFSTPSYKKPQIGKYGTLTNSNKKLCLFFPRCHTMDCNFYHPKPCRYGVNCTDPKCIYYHPGTGSIGELKKGGKLPAFHQLKWSKAKAEEKTRPEPVITAST